MNIEDIFKSIGQAISSAPRSDYTAELHLQVIKYADSLSDISGKFFCDKIGIAESYKTEFVKMRKIAERLRAAGLDPEKI